jgi:CRP-like cAMP-binding protein
VAKYERWQMGRLVLREGHRALFFYVILDGECEIFAQNKDEINQQMEEYEDLSDEEKAIKLKELQNAHIKMLGSMASGSNVPLN